MPTYNELTIKFTNDWVDDDVLAFATSSFSSRASFTWVTSRSGSYQVTSGSPTGTAGETAAINFKAAFDLDFPTGYVTTIQNVNEVLIQSETEGEIFEYAQPIGDGTTTVTYNNTVETQKINVRSPHFIEAERILLTRCVLKLRVYTGTQDVDISTTTYEVDLDAYNNKCTFEISQLISDFLDVDFNDSFTSQVVWVNYSFTEYVDDIPVDYGYVGQMVAFDGYGYFEDGANPELGNRLLQTNTTMYVYDGNYFYIPVQQDELTQVDLIADGTVIDTDTFTTTTDSGDVIRYIAFTNPNFCDGENYLFQDGSQYLFEDANVYTFNVAQSELADEILLTFSDLSTQTINVVTVFERKYTPYRLTFINKFGALQSIWMFKKSDLSIKIDSEQYRGYGYSNLTYSTSEHQYRNLFVSGKESIKLNSGFYPEAHNAVFKELLLSEKVWIHYEGNLLPVNAKTSQLSFKTSVSDKLINYSIEFDFAFDKINAIY